MKNFFKARMAPLWGIIALAAVIGLGITACNNGNGPDDDIFEGTWIAMDPDTDLEFIKFVAANGTWKQYTYVIVGISNSDGEEITSIPLKDVEATRGTYTVSGSTVNFTCTEVNTGFENWQGEWEDFTPGEDDEWTNFAELDADEYGPQTYPLTITGGNQIITPDGMTFKKQ